MERIFRIDFYPQEWLTQTSHMTIEQRGLFIQVCSMIYANQKQIKNDPAHIGRVSNCSARLAKTLIDQLVKQGDLVVRGEFVTQKRCELELNAKRTYIERGAKGGRKKAENAGEHNKNSSIAPSKIEKELPSTSLPYPESIEEGTNVPPSPPIPQGGMDSVFLAKYIMPDGTMLSLDGFFERMWLLYPALRDKGHKGKAREFLIKKLKEGESYENIGRGVAKFREYCEATGEKQPDFFRWLRDDGFKRPYTFTTPNNRPASRASTSGERKDEERRAALTEAAKDLGLI